ncbi:hypothetical protein V4U86_14975 [Mycobacterium sp. AMU20-3851]|uniref:hypothetical protein n=1 Tax=Mycobacterium sp. AMU20-3851 TaxID=3122055 RepID=UPI00375444EC
MNALIQHPRLRPAATAVIPAYLVAAWLFPPATGVASVLAGLGVAVVGAAAARHIVGPAPAILLAAAGTALALSGISADRSWDAALVTAFSVLGAVAVFLAGTDTTLAAPWRLLFAAAGVLALVGYFGAVGGDPAHAVPLVAFPVLAAAFALGWVRRRVPV